jgi:hypothetical protein
MNQIARLRTVPKNIPGRSGFKKTNGNQAKLLRIAETIASAARIIAQLDADALLSPISAAPTNESKCTGHHDEVAKSMWPSI